MKQRDWAKDYTDLLAERDKLRQEVETLRLIHNAEFLKWKARAEAAEKHATVLREALTEIAYLDDLVKRARATLEDET